MAATLPPDDCAGVPRAITHPAGTLLWRVHESARPAGQFNPTVQDRHFGGGRFDATKDDVYPYLYVASSRTTALAETLLRGLPFTNGRPRTLQRAKIKDKRLSALELRTDIRLLALTRTVDLARICQDDDWLIRAQESDYGKTRRWAHWIRARSSWAQGIIWTSHRDAPECSIILFGDRCPADAVRPVPASAVPLDDADGARFLNDQLKPYGVQVRPPSLRHSPAGRGR
ncbi:RES domain-containing protein [Actinomadura sp. KC216]|uniref:RES family NAD+ phosphorylase n=1 Tax=Actinomadura sp. KC216 TaxID=2530370 RepID=UPI0010429CDA|nr:RES family NAD+ phosphorylase [Actinomadura sp. KC216]TDB82201.1 RES domain-containing protein [Actinomadura sp. KC216]